MNWTKIVVNVLGAVAIGYTAGGWKGAVAAGLSNLTALFQEPPHQS